MNPRPNFYSAPWNNPLNSDGWMCFKVGTCYGQWRSAGRAYEILSVVNDNPGNGDFQHTLSWFYDSCKRDSKILRIREIWNQGLAKHLAKIGFEHEIGHDMIKRKFD